MVSRLCGETYSHRKNRTASIAHTTSQAARTPKSSASPNEGAAPTMIWRSLAQVDHVDQCIAVVGLAREERAEQVEDLAHRQARVERDRLKLDADPALDLPGLAGDVQAQYARSQNRARATPL
ncbi:MAG TPA: hypothetical protein VGJ87_06410 [Roseiflexaceae bacterium]|jgi:hypothetical protein